MKEFLFAVVDVGSNTVRLCVYRVTGSSDFEKVVDSCEAVGLASYVDDRGAMSDAGIKVSCKAVSKMAGMAKLLRCDRISTFATAAIRNCSNTEEVVRAIKRKTGFDVRVLSGTEEAEMSALGASRSTGIKSGLFFDLGGGSTELALLSEGRVLGSCSIPMGALSSWKRLSSNLLCTPADAELIQETFSELLDRSGMLAMKCSQVVAIGGSMRLALKVAQRMSNGLESHQLKLSDLGRIMDLGESHPEHLARMILEMKPERVHTFVPACAIAQSVLGDSGCSKMTVSKTGIREGFALSQLP